MFTLTYVGNTNTPPLIYSFLENIHPLYECSMFLNTFLIILFLFFRYVSFWLSLGKLTVRVYVQIHCTVYSATHKGLACYDGLNLSRRSQVKIKCYVFKWLI